MNLNINHRLVMFGRVDTYGTEHPLTPANERATALFTELKAVITNMQSAVRSQENGLGEFLGGASDCQRVVEELRENMRDLTKTARTLDPDLFPGVREEFRMPRTRKFEVLVAVARGLLDKIGPIKVALIQHGMAADFDEGIAGQLAVLEGATARKYAGGHTRKSGTLGLAEKSRHGMEIVRKLDAIYRNRLRKTDPVLYGVWKAASRLESMPVRAKVASAPAPSAGTPPVTAPTTA